MPFHAVIFLGAIFLLVKSADYLIEYATKIAYRLDISELIVGLVLTSVGTSLPELASSVSAARAGSSGLVIGNVVGSNIANIGLVMGVAAVVRPFATERKMHDRDGFIMLASVVVFFFMSLDNVIGRVDATVLLVVYVAYVVFAARSDRSGIEHRFRDFLKFVFDFEYATPIVRRLTARKSGKVRGRGTGKDIRLRPMLVDSAVVAVSLAVLIVSAHYVVVEAVWFARVLRLPENLIGVSVIAIGTSLPELMVSVSAARKGKGALIVGNVIGSNIANILLIVGLSALVHRIDVAEQSVVYTIPIMLFFTLALLYFIRRNWRVSRLEGALAICSYVAFLGMAFWKGLG